MNKFIIRNSENIPSVFYLLDENGNVLKKSQQEFTLVRFVKNNYPESEVSIEYVDAPPRRKNEFAGYIHGDNPLPKEPVRRITNHEDIFAQFN